MKVAAFERFTFLPKDRGQREEFFRVFLKQVYFTYFQAMPLLSIMALFAGLMVAAQVKLGLSLMGGSSKLGHFLIVILFRELAPFLSGLVLITRSATACASELATMKVQGEVEALEAMGIDFRQYILGPRILAGTVSIVCMGIYFVLIGLLGAWTGANFFGHYPFSELISQFATELEPLDIVFFLTKTATIGLVVFRLASKIGLSLNRAPFEVPIVTNRAVVECLFASLGLQLFLSLVFYLLIGVSV